MIEINPSNSDYFVERANIYYLLESWRFASNDYSMALDINPKLDEVWHHYGMCQYNLDNIESACNAWRRAAGMKNRDAVKMLFKECGI
jgi:lipoprotein NlpI